MGKRIFYDWVPPKLDLAILIVLSICLGLNAGIPAQLSVYMVDALGTNPADAGMCNYAYFAGMTTSFVIIDKLKGAFPTKQVLLFICILLIGCNTVLSRTDSASLMVLMNFFIGVFRLMGAIMMIAHIFPIIMPRGYRFQVYCLYFPITLMVSPICGWAMVEIANRFDWSYSFHFSNAMLLLALLIITITVHGRREPRRIPLWKLDWFSHFLIAGWTMSFIYILVYGRTMNWFDAHQIWAACVIFIACILLLLIRNMTVPKPLLRFEIMKTWNITVGLLLMFFFGAFFTMTNILNTLMNTAFHQNALFNARMNTWPVAGYITGSVVCYVYFTYFNNFRAIILAAIACYGLSCFMLYFLISPRISANQLILPLIIRGMAIIFSYISVGLYIVAKVPGKYLPVIPFFLIFFRTYLGPVIWGNLYTNWLADQQVILLDHLATWGHSDIADTTMNERFQHNPVAVYQAFHQQAVLESLKKLMGILCYGAIAYFIIVALLPLHITVDRRIFNWKKKHNADDLAPTMVA